MNNLAERLNTWTDHCDRFGMGVIVLRLDIFSRILVNLDIDQEMEDTVGNLHLIAVAMERSQYSNITSEGYRPPVNFFSVGTGLRSTGNKFHFRCGKDNS